MKIDSDRANQHFILRKLCSKGHMRKKNFAMLWTENKLYYLKINGTETF